MLEFRFSWEFVVVFAIVVAEFEYRNNLRNNRQHNKRMHSSECQVDKWYLAGNLTQFVDFIHVTHEKLFHHLLEMKTNRSSVFLVK